MRLNSLKKSLLIIALALGQWLVLAHGLEHPALAQDQACQICLHAQGLDSGATASIALPNLVLPQQHETPVETPSVSLQQVVATAHPIRGPPHVVS